VVKSYPRSTTAGGPTASVQSVENTAIPETADLAYVDVTRPVSQIVARVDISKQALDRMGPRSQLGILADFDRACSDVLDDQLINGSGASGQVAGLRLNFPSTVTWDDTIPTRSEFVSRIARLASDVAVVRKQPPDIVVMTARRWWWTVGGTQPATGTDVASIGAQVDARPDGPFAGFLSGLRVVVDDHLPQTLGAGTNQDTVLVLRSSDLLLDLEGGRDGRARVTADLETGANTQTVHIIGHRLAWFSADRYRALGQGQLVGTGLVAPGAW
jgi:Phage capsid family